MLQDASRRSFLQTVGLGSLAVVAADRVGSAASAQPPDAKVLGAAGVKTTAAPASVWRPVSDRKIRVGIVGYGVCRFGAAFGFQDHPNVTVAAVSDLQPDRREALAKACRCAKTYPSLEELLKDDVIEAVYDRCRHRGARIGIEERRNAEDPAVRMTRPLQCAPHLCPTAAAGHGRAAGLPRRRKASRCLGRGLASGFNAVAGGRRPASASGPASR